MTTKKISSEEATERLKSFTENIQALAEDDGISEIIISCSMDLRDGERMCMAYGQKLAENKIVSMNFIQKTLEIIRERVGHDVFTQVLMRMMMDAMGKKEDEE